jgi:hypothetical protein
MTRPRCSRAADTVPWERLAYQWVAKGIVFLASDDVGSMSGAGLIVDTALSRELRGTQPF